MNIAIGADHGGFELKPIVVRQLERLGHVVDDVGCHSTDSVDYPDFADLVCQAVLAGRADCGILICGTGIGMSMAANRYRGIRAAVCHDDYTARFSRQHNNANVLCFGARVIGPGVAEGLVQAWLGASFDGGRHQIRIGKFS
ncbi:MAG: ribose 5-phosphate isomerase B [Desulfofustis sp.]|nr:ribose 5-phosphate isomerase B [Desulfofustis sp.]